MSIRFDEDLVLAKTATIRRCVETIEKLWSQADSGFPDWARLDITVLNLQRAVQACLDLSNHLIAANAWGLPSSAVEAIESLVDHNVLATADARVYRGMIGFRNVAVHNYTAINEAIVAAIVHHHLTDLTTFADQILQATLNQDAKGH